MDLFFEEVYRWLKSTLQPEVWAGFVFSIVATWLIFKLIRNYRELTFKKTLRSWEFQTGLSVILCAIWLSVVGYQLYQSYRRLPTETLRVAVGNFWGNSPRAMEEGQALGVLVKDEIASIAFKGGKVELVPELSDAVIRTCDDARGQTQRIAADLVVGGVVLHVGGQVQLRPVICPLSVSWGPGLPTPAPSALIINPSDPNRLEMTEGTAREVAHGVYAIGSYLRGDLENAIKAFDSISRKTEDIWLYLAASYFLIDPPNFPEGKYSAAKALAINPRSANAMNVLGGILFLEGDLENAAKEFRRAIETGGGALPMRNLANLEVWRGDTDRAVSLLDDALASEEIEGTLLCDLLADKGYIFFTRREMNEAEVSLRESVNACPKYARGYNLLGNVLFAKGDRAEAYEALKKAVEINPDYAVAYNNLGRVAFRLGKKREAIEFLQRAIEINSKYAHAYNNWGVVLQSLRNYPEAEEKYTQAANIDPNYPDPWHNLWGLYVEMGRPEMARYAISRFEALRSERPPEGDYPVIQRGVR